VSEPSSPPFDDPRVVAQYEDWYSTRFGALADELELRLLMELLQNVEPRASILEVGCGTGHFGSALQARAFRVTGVDPAKAMLECAQARFPVAIGDGARLPFADSSFDAALLVAVLDFVDDPAAVLREARRVARSQVVVLALVSHSALALRRRISAWRGHPIFATARFYSRRQILAFARQAGATQARDVRQILVLPPALAARFPALERDLSRRDLTWGGILGFRIDARGE